MIILTIKYINRIKDGNLENTSMGRVGAHIH